MVYCDAQHLANIYAAAMRTQRPTASSPTTSTTARVRALQVRCGLTDAEAGITARIAEAQSVKQISLQLGICESTVRVHLRRIYAKTGAHRQAVLMRLVMREQHGGDG